ncbi:MAG: hypothetical protein KDC79_05905 [Cyclobacteriaceae bacterium]|nr:hypothetical protein [Cyclobacteriaceae bacterium]
MKLDLIRKEHILLAAKQIDVIGIPRDFVWSQYYVVVNKKEYPFKYLVRTASKLVSYDELIDFKSNEYNRKHIKELGFELTYYEGGYNFFTKEELDFYESIYNEDYRKENENQKNYGEKLYPILRKLKYWLEQIKPEEYKIVYDGKWLGAHTKVSEYFWPRIYKGEDKDIFFNAEVAAYGRFIGFKLDGYYSTKRKLPDNKIKILEEFKANQANEWSWYKIPFNDIHLYNWERLIDECKAYLSKHASNYDYLKKLLYKEHKVARITWNINGWVKPSGRMGKSQNNSFEFKNGFGHEEWLFDGDKIIDGYKYGFLEPIRKYRHKYEGKILDISLYTRDSKSNKSFWVAYIENVEVLSTNISKKIIAYYKRVGWYDEMKEDLYNLNLDPKQLDIWTGKGPEQLFNVRFKTSQLNKIPNELIPMSENSGIHSNRYTLMDATSQIQESFDKFVKSGFSFENSGSEEADLDTKGKRKGCIDEIELEYKHNDIQKKFLKYLQLIHGRSNVKRECTAFGASRIDIVRKTTTGYIFYEIKTHNSLIRSIRNSVGQLLEYCLYPNTQEAEELILVSHLAPNDEIKNYVLHLKTFLKIPFKYIHFDIESEKVVSEI